MLKQGIRPTMGDETCLFGEWLLGKAQLFLSFTLPNFNSSPLKSYQVPIGKDRLPVPPFFGANC